jgi:hypothetical protein
MIITGAITLAALLFITALVIRGRANNATEVAADPNPPLMTVVQQPAAAAQGPSLVQIPAPNGANGPNAQPGQQLPLTQTGTLQPLVQAGTLPTQPGMQPPRQADPNLTFEIADAGVRPPSAVVLPQSMQPASQAPQGQPRGKPWKPGAPAQAGQPARPTQPTPGKSGALPSELLGQE